MHEENEKKVKNHNQVKLLCTLSGGERLCLAGNALVSLLFIPGRKLRYT